MRAAGVPIVPVNPSQESSLKALLGIPGRNSYTVTAERVDMRRPQVPGQSIQVKALPQSLTLDVRRTALVIIDMQNDFCSPQGWLGQRGVNVGPLLSLVSPINSISRAVREREMPVIWLNWGVRPDRLNLSPGTQHPFNPQGRGPGLAGPTTGPMGPYNLLEQDSWGAQLVDGLSAERGDIRIHKHRISGFWDTPLDSILRNLRVDSLLFAGVNADHCVLGTLMDANFHGYDTILLEDCTATTSPDFCLQATFHNVRFCFGFTTTSQQLLAGLDDPTSDG
jgi:ureidoacrylate peracid hydrolase